MVSTEGIYHLYLIGGADIEVLGLQICATMYGFYTGSGDLNLTFTLTRPSTFATFPSAPSFLEVSVQGTGVSAVKGE